MKLKRLYPLLILITLLSILSCEKMEDLHYKYLENGEIRYTTKLDSVETYAGNGRVLLTGMLINPFCVDHIMIYYNDFNDSLEFPYVNESAIDSLQLMVNDLEEKSYTFYVYTGDDEGNRSVKVTAFASSYGEKYRQGLLSRTINTISTRNDSLIISWLPADEKERGSELKYTSTTGSDASINIPSDSTTTIITDFSEGFSYRTQYIPEANAIDSFPSDWDEKEISIWQSNGISINPITGTSTFSLDKIFTKKADKIYETDYANLGEYDFRMRLTINNDNTVDITPLGEALETEPNGPNTYDPLNQKFTLNYKFNAIGGYNTVSETINKK